MLNEEGLHVLTASSAEDGLMLAQEHQLALVVLDVRLPGRDGITALPDFLNATQHAPVVVMTAFGDLETAVGAVRNGASDYLAKPFRLEDALATCRKALLLAQGERVETPHQNTTERDNKLIGQSAAMQQVFRQIALVARSNLSVLITGETGTGKELVAAAVHHHSGRSHAPYVPVALVALNPELIESELFGHAKGAFTGAWDDRRGLFEQAEGGTILLDEIGDLPLPTQVKLLRVLESGHYTRVGDLRPRQANVRILAATNSDLRQAVDEGHFREDLFYRLNGLHIALPPLRERSEDVGMLCEHFLQAIDYPAAGAAIDATLLSHLQTRYWRGNIRELRNAVEHAAVLARGRPLVSTDFPPESVRGETTVGAEVDDIAQRVSRWTESALQREANEGKLHDLFLQTFEPALLKAVLAYAGNNKLKAAEILGIHRGTLRERMRAYDLE
jgi:two-component system nitrogen regulation response regulator GlnG